MSPRERLVVSGGIGSGKSTVIGVFGSLGWSVIDADQVGHRVLTDPLVIVAVGARWPKAVTGGEVNRAALAATVFADDKELAVLEQMTQPRIVDEVERWVRRQVSPTVVEVSVLNLARPDWGPVAIVHAPRLVRIERAVERGMSRADVEARMAAQMPDSDLLAAADFVIDNQGTPDQLRGHATQLAVWLRQ